MPSQGAAIVRKTGVYSRVSFCTWRPARSTGNLEIFGQLSPEKSYTWGTWNLFTENSEHLLFIRLLPCRLFNCLQQAGVAEGVPAPGHVGLRDQLEADRAQVIHIFVLGVAWSRLWVSDTQPGAFRRIWFTVSHFSISESIFHMGKNWFYHYNTMHILNWCC